MEEKSEPQENTVETPDNEPVKPKEIAFAEADVSNRYDDVYEVLTPGDVTGVLWRNGAYEFTCTNHVSLRLQVIDAGMIRLTYSPDGRFGPTLSYAVDPAFDPGKVTVTLHEHENDYLLATEKLQVVVDKVGLRVRFYDTDDRLLCEDAGGYSARRSVMRGWNRFSIEKRCHKRDVFYGLGDKTCSANLHGRTFENWCTDAFAFGRDTDPLYRAIPFYYASGMHGAYGIFLDNSFRSFFDFNSADNGVVAFATEGGDMSYVFIGGPTLDDVACHYHQLTGKPELPPLWALGYHQCRWSYYPESRVRAIADGFREHQIPCDAIYLDIDYMDGWRCFTWDYSHFPDPAGLIADLREQGFQTVVILRTADGDVAKAPVWPGFCAFPDFTHPGVREWWGKLYRELYVDQGVSGFWNDMNEPAVFHVNHKTLPDHVVHHHDGFPCSHRKAHNVYGLLMTRASYEGFKKLQPQKRPFLLTRATFCGGQRYAAVWTGDNVSDWEHLQIANIQCQRLSISGFSFCGTDIGGFAGKAEGELFVRWLQLSVFHPLMRVHSMGQHTSGDAITDEAQLTDPALHVSDQEPWSFGEKWTPLAKNAIELRYCLLPCLYTAMWQNSTRGIPVIRHLGFEDPADPKLWDQERDFRFGEHLLVSPVIQPKVQRQSVYLPKGTWYYFWTGQPCHGELFVNVMPDQIPFFVREGAVLPVYPVRQWTGEKPVDELTLYVYYKNGTETSSLYEDEGEGYGYQNGLFSLKTFRTEGTEDRLSVEQTTEGDWKIPYERVKIYLVGFPTYVRHCEVDGEEMPIKELRLRERSLYTLDVRPDFKTITWNA
jgi:alpha-glucosidase